MNKSAEREVQTESEPHHGLYNEMTDIESIRKRQLRRVYFIVKCVTTNVGSKNTIPKHMKSKNRPHKSCVSLGKGMNVDPIQITTF